MGNKKKKKGWFSSTFTPNLGDVDSIQDEIAKIQARLKDNEYRGQ